LASLRERDHFDALDTAAAPIAASVHGIDLDQALLAKECKIALHARAPVAVDHLGKVARPDYTESSHIGEDLALLVAQ
jgi:hypothetical protein